LGAVFFVGILVLACLLFLLEARQRQVVLPVLGQVADFTLTNQDGRLTTLADLTNHVWIADIIFTRCAGQCPGMMQRMKSVQDVLPADSEAKLVTLTTDPDYDSPAIMKRYGGLFGADFSRWMLLTGTKAQIASLGANSLKLSAVPIKPEDQKSAVDLFIHTTIFVIVDKHAQLRGTFETGGDGVDWTNVVEPQLIRTIHQLEHES
jgi:cytochrome oxidase Cu insertion factor (SCO1/SenC/PrrC family)